VKPIASTIIVKGTTPYIVRAREVGFHFDFNAKATVKDATINKKAPTDIGLPRLETTLPPLIRIPK
jgi:hypothetical protein